MAWRHHDEHELAWVIRGSVLIDTSDARWRVTPSHALWIPSGVAHKVQRPPADTLILLALVPREAGIDPIGRVAGVSRTDELAVHAEALLQPLMLDSQARQAAHRGLLASLPRHVLPGGPLPLPNDVAARKVAQQLLRAPYTQRTLEQWADSLYVSSKTLQRRFAEETGLTFTAWRQRARLTTAQNLLAQGVTVAAVASRVGFAGPSTFIQAYKREFGTTPGRDASGL